MALTVGPSKRRDEWRGFFGGKTWNPDAFRALIDSDDPGSAFFEIETQINGLYRSRQMLGAPSGPGVMDTPRFKAEWLNANSRAAREALGPLQRDLDLGIMAWIRRASCLSAVIGAGVTMDAGGPSWTELVRRLLVLATTRGHEIAEMREEPGGTPESRSWKRVVTATKHLEPPALTRAQEILALIESGNADTEALMEATQLCLDLMGQHMFADITQILYENDRLPGPIHNSIADLAAPQFVPDRGGDFPGWDSLITYNFDNLMGEALDARGLARASYAMSGDQIGGDPNELALAAGQKSLHQRIYHLHGYTPRKNFLITHVQFVFSTAQYLRTYKNRDGIIDFVFRSWLANPIHHALYIGCSFLDDAMNDLLRDAAETLPGRYHYAFLKWPGDQAYERSTPQEIAEQGAAYELIGVRPVWFDRFDEIPEFIRRLA